MESDDLEQDSTRQTKTDVLNGPNSYISLLDESHSIDEFDKNQSIWSTSFDRLRLWTSRSFRLTRFALQQRFDNIERTEDVQIEEKIRLFEETRQQYRRSLSQLKSIRSHLQSIVGTQRNFIETLTEIQRISVNFDDLSDELVRNNLCQQNLVVEEEILLNTLGTFICKLQTMIDVIMDDTDRTIQLYREKRDEFDCCRHQYQLLVDRHRRRSLFWRPASNNEADLLLGQYQRSQEIYQRMKERLNVKIIYLEQHRVQTMKDQFSSLHQSIVSFFSVNRQKLNSSSTGNTR